MTGDETPEAHPVPSERFHRVLAFASDEADGLGHGYITCQHLLYALAIERRGLASAVFDRVGITPDALHDLLVDSDASHDRIGQGHLDLANEVQHAISRAVRAAEEWQDRILDTEHLLFGVLSQQSSGDELLASLHLKPQALLIELQALRTSAPPMVIRDETTHAYRLTVESAWVLGLAAENARQNGAREIDTIHVLAALIAVDGQVMAAMSETLSVSMPVIREAMSRPDTIPNTAKRLPLADEVQSALGFAIGQAWNRGHLSVSPLHLAMGIARMPDCKATDMLADHQVSQSDFIEAIEAVMPHAQDR